MDMPVPNFLIGDDFTAQLAQGTDRSLSSLLTKDYQMPMRILARKTDIRRARRAFKCSAVQNEYPNFSMRNGKMIGQCCLAPGSA